MTDKNGQKKILSVLSTGERIFLNFLFIIDAGIGWFEDFSELCFFTSAGILFRGRLCQNCFGFFMDTGAEILGPLLFIHFHYCICHEVRDTKFLFLQFVKVDIAVEIFAAMTDFFKNIEIHGIFIKTDTFFNTAG